MIYYKTNSNVTNVIYYCSSIFTRIKWLRKYFFFPSLVSPPRSSVFGLSPILHNYITTVRALINITYTWSIEAIDVVIETVWTNWRYVKPRKRAVRTMHRPRIYSRANDAQTQGFQICRTHFPVHTSLPEKKEKLFLISPGDLYYYATECKNIYKNVHLNF